MSDPSLSADARRQRLSTEFEAWGADAIANLRDASRRGVTFLCSQSDWIVDGLG